MAGLAGGQVGEVGGGVKGPGAIGVDPEATAAAAGGDAAINPGGGAVDGGDTQPVAAVRVAVIEQQVAVGIDADIVAGATGGLVIRHL